MWLNASADERERLRKIRLNQVFPQKDTKIEVALQNELKKRGIEFVAHIPLIVCQPDIFIPEGRLVIFADGCFYHRCPLHRKAPNSKIPLTTSKRDQYQTAFLLRHGYNVLRFWEHDINKDVVACVDQIANVLYSPKNELTSDTKNLQPSMSKPAGM
jgi:DNA mismatch endonuclease (patch repair protein)